MTNSELIEAAIILILIAGVLFDQWTIRFANKVIAEQRELIDSQATQIEILKEKIK